MDPATQRVTLDCTCINQAGHCAIRGEAEVQAPVERIVRPRAALPEVRLSAGNDGMRRLLDFAKPLGTIRVAVVHPCDAASLGGAVEARRAGRSEARRVGKECVSTCSSRGSPYH